MKKLLSIVCLFISLVTLKLHGQDIKVVNLDSLLNNYTQHSEWKLATELYSILEAPKYKLSTKTTLVLLYQNWVLNYQKFEKLKKQSYLYEKWSKTARLKEIQGETSDLESSLVEVHCASFENKLMSLELNYLAISQNLREVYANKFDLFPTEQKLSLLKEVEALRKSTDKIWKLKFKKLEHFEKDLLPLAKKLKHKAKLRFDAEDISLDHYMKALEKATQIEFDYLHHILDMNLYFYFIKNNN